MFVVNTHITLFSQKLGKTLVFNYVTNGVIDSSWQNLTDTCELTFAKKLFYKDDKLQNLLSAGDKVNVRIGYDGQLTDEFAGYLVRFNAKIPLTMFFEDNMWVMKKGSITKSFGSNAKLTEVVDHIVKYYNSKFNAGFKSVVENAELGSFSVKDLTGAKILEKLKSTYGIYAYFRSDTLYVGFAYQIKEGSVNTVKYAFNRNIINDNLEYRTAEDSKIRIKAISIQKDNKKVIAFSGDADGGLHTVHLPIGMSKAAVEKQAKVEETRMRFDGYKGSLIGFYKPVIRHGDVCEVIDLEWPEREGRFLVDRVVTNFGVNGIRRMVQPGKKA
jgi:hypothetical protein